MCRRGGGAVGWGRWGTIRGREEERVKPRVGWETERWIDG